MIHPQNTKHLPICSRNLKPISFAPHVHEDAKMSSGHLLMDNTRQAEAIFFFQSQELLDRDDNFQTLRSKGLCLVLKRRILSFFGNVPPASKWPNFSLSVVHQLPRFR